MTRSIARDSGPRCVAVPYVGANAGRQLRLRRGDTLVTRFDDATIRAGGVSPKAIGKYLLAGVRVFRADGLHAKVYVSAARAIVGSANLSKSSEAHLLEAGFVTRKASLVAQARRLVMDLAARSSFIGPELARAKEGIYRPPFVPSSRRSSSKAHREADPRFWLTKVRYEEQDGNADSASERAHARIPVRPDSARYWQEDVEIAETHGGARIRAGDEMLQIFRSSRSIWLEPLAVIAAVEPFKSKRGAKKRMIVVESRKGLHDRRLSALKSVLRPAEVRRLTRTAGPTECRDPKLVERLRKVWKR